MASFEFKSRYYWVLSAIILAGVILSAWVTRVMILRHNTGPSPWDYSREVTLTGARGDIVTRDGTLLATTVDAYRLTFDPNHFFRNERQHEEFVRDYLSQFDTWDQERWAGWLAADPAEIVTASVLVARVVGRGEAERIRGLRDQGIKCFALELLPRRAYPQDSLAGLLIGFVNHQGVGVYGLEQRFDEVLAGSSYTYDLEQDGARDPYLYQEVVDRDLLYGSTLRLSIDAYLQGFVEDRLHETVARYEAESGIAIVTDPSTGELLAMASAPSVNPNLGGQVPSEFWSIDAVQAAWEPGSILKAVTFALALEHRLTRPEELYPTHNGRMVVHDRVVRDTTRADAEITLRRAFEISSNIVTVQLGQAIDSERFVEGLRRFGFGERLSIGLPSEENLRLQAAPWNPVDLSNRAFGQGIAASPLRTHMAINALANGGMWVAPRLVLGVEHRDGSFEEHQPSLEPRRAVSEETARVMASLMQSATEADRATGRAAFISDDLPVAGKTGTSEIFDLESRRYSGQYIAGFSGWVPAHDPRFVITVMVYKPNKDIAHHGGRVAAPLFKEIALEALRATGYFVSDEPSVSEPVETSAGAAAPADSDDVSELTEDSLAQGVMPDLVGANLRQSIRSLHEASLGVNIQGVGQIVGHEPAAGSSIEPGMTVQLELGWR